MSIEGQTLDRKSLRYALGRHEDADGLACVCVGFANAMGGVILLGIEDGQDEPPGGQKVPEELPDRLRKRIAQITVNVGVAIRKVTAGNGADFVEVQVFRNEQGIAATSDGRYFIRVSDETRRLMPDDLGRLMAEKNSFVWELQTTQRVSAHGFDKAKLADFVKRVRASDRVSEFVRGKPEGELLANALVHRPYMQRGDIFLNLYPDRLEVHNPGLLPIGVTPSNILHTSSKRNPHLAKVFYDLKLMEGEGSGFDRMYEVLLSSGRPIPDVQQGDDRVVVTVRKQIARTSIVDFMVKADLTLQPTQRELITLGLLAQHEALTAIELVKVLELSRAEDLKHWIGRLKDWGVVSSRGRTKATEYFVEPDVLRKLEFQGGTTLKGIERHRLRELILRDLEIYRKASISEIHGRIGAEIPRRKIRRELGELVAENEIGSQGVKRSTVYVWTK